jgi:hypothetical protein
MSITHEAKNPRDEKIVAALTAARAKLAEAAEILVNAHRKQREEDAENLNNAYLDDVWGWVDATTKEIDRLAEDFK